MNRRHTKVALLIGCMFTASISLAETFPDPLLTTPGTPEVTSQGLQADGYSLGVSAYSYGYALVRMERVIRDYTDVPSPKPATSYRAPLNNIGWARELATPEAKDMPTANNDTLYMSSVVVLDQPYVFEVPDTKNRYYVVNVFNMWQEIEKYIGKRTTGTKAGKFVLVPPNWKGDIPKSMTRIDVSTNKVWLWGRLQVKQGEEMSPIHKLQDQFKLTTLDGKPSSIKSLPPMPEIKGDEFGFFKHLSFALQQNDIKSADEALFAQYERFGLTKDSFDPNKMSKDMKQGLLKGLEDAPKAVVSSFASTAAIRQGWTWVTGLDSFGYNYPLRSMIAGPYLGGNGEKEAIYPIRYTDSNNEILSGQNDYVLKFNQVPPVGEFWSLTMYNADDKMLIKNDLKRYKVGSDTIGLKIKENGSFEIPISHLQPEGEFSDNWLPAPSEDFYIILRMYSPNDAILEGRYILPQVEKTQ
ncbi:DUF1254 domain-containing protein [Psychromonas aquimarina]|uniref:DUF1254 domain-containing protein n=1 Tax=Psychromonas aquimarina TaxID=444919 RepID=UPI00041D9E77|nr:DUF1254 domain-containing protein [Psychromonas aquimarina]